MHVPDMSGRTVVVTGGNSGIGFETAAALAAAGARVVITARDPDRGHDALERLRGRDPKGSVELVLFDLASLDSVRAGADELLSLDRIDVLVNNAGLMLSERRQTVDGMEMTFQVNHLGPFLLTVLLLDRLKGSAPARIVNVASTAHKGARSMGFDDLQATGGYRGMAVYSRSKLANVLFTRELARRLEGTGVTANSLHPGTVRTGWAGDGDSQGLMAIGMRIARPFFIGPAKGAETSIYLASSPEVEGVSGRYFVRCRDRTPSRAARDDDAARRLWEVSEELAGLVPA
ncbi:MAG TPA: SDR family oxidoreductase [Acidimicrobiales bacterium]|nr:SDR family oxidoreductase [Acidimicrobiales bacterium]